MPTVYLAPGVFGAGGQMFTSGGLPLDEGLVYTSIAGGTTPAATYTTSAGNIQNANPIELNADGRFPDEVWLEEGVSYRFTLRDSAGNLIGTYDNLRGVNDIGLYTTAYTRTFLLADSAATARDILVLGDTDDVQFKDITSVGDVDVSGALSVGGNTSVDGSLASDGLLDISAATAGQIQFPATQNSSSNANTLDDYEEGTWTPSLGGNATYVEQVGRYTKIGRMVFLYCRVQVNTIGTGSAQQISGVPFQPAQNAVWVVGKFGSFAVNVVNICGHQSTGFNLINMVGATAAAGGNSAQNVFGNSANVEMTCAMEV